MILLRLTEYEITITNGARIIVKDSVFSFSATDIDISTSLQNLIQCPTNLHFTTKNCDKTFLKNILRLLKTMTFRGWLNVIIKSKKYLFAAGYLYRWMIKS